MCWCAGSWHAHLRAVQDRMLRKMIYVPRLPGESAETHTHDKMGMLAAYLQGKTQTPTW